MDCAQATRVEFAPTGIRDVAKTRTAESGGLKFSGLSLSTFLGTGRTAHREVTSPKPNICDL